jgi:hypothetical protein
MTQPAELAAKGDAVEEWIDLRFFRPIGFRLARWLLPTKVSPDAVTAFSLLLGLLAGHLFYYRDWRLNALGLVLFIVSDLFDSVDGQLARMRGKGTRLGAVLDGMSDNARFANLYFHLIARLLVGGYGLFAIVLGLAAGISHSLQATATDFMRKAYLYFTGADGIDLPEDIEAAVNDKLGIARGPYIAYARNQTRLFPASAELVRTARRTTSAPLPVAWARSQRSTVVWCALIGQNIRFLLLGITAMVGWPAGFFWLTLVPLNLALVILVTRHERCARAFQRASSPEAARSHYAT